MHLVPEIEIAPVEAAPRGGVGIHPGVPFAPLHHHRRVRDQRVAADMVEMEMRIDDEVDLGRIAADRFQPGADFLAWPVVECEQTGDAGADPTGGVVLAIGMHPGIEQHRALGMFDQIGRDRQLRPPSPPSIRYPRSPLSQPQVKANSLTLISASSRCRASEVRCLEHAPVQREVIGPLGERFRIPLAALRAVKIAAIDVDCAGQPRQWVGHRMDDVAPERLGVA